MPIDTIHSDNRRGVAGVYTHYQRKTGDAHDGHGEDGPTAASTGRSCADALQGAAVTAITERTDYLIWSATVTVTSAEQA